MCVSLTEDRQTSLMGWTPGPRCMPERVSPVWFLKFPSVSWGSKSQFIYRRCSFSWSWPLCVFLERWFVALETGFLSSPASTADTGHHRTVCT